jgi:hypothetical protein
LNGFELLQGIIIVVISVIPMALSYHLGSREPRKGFGEIGEAMHEGFSKMDERFERIAEQHTKILEAMEKRGEKS